MSADDARIVAQWTGIYDAVYRSVGRRGPERDFAGFRSGITGENYTDDEVVEWIDGTAEAILRRRPDAVLDVGAGTGLIGRELLPHLSRYVGTDIAPEGVARLEEFFPGAPGARFAVRAADELDGLGTFDVVVLNSVIQHFPGAGYLRRALDRALDACAPDGAVLVGDVPSLAVRELHHLCVLAVRARLDTLRCGEVLDHLAAAATRERELVVDPAFFTAYAAERGVHADVRLKPGRHRTEMNVFRYDVWLHHDGAGLVRPGQGPPWAGEPATALLDRVAGLPGTVTGIGRPELSALAATLEEIRRAPPDAAADLDAVWTTPAVAGPGIAPADLAAAATERGLAALCTPAATDPAAYDAVLVDPAAHTGLALPHRGGDRALTTTPARQHTGGPG